MFHVFYFLERQIQNTGCNPVDLKQMDSAKFKIEKKEAESKVVVTIAEGTPIPTIQALKMALVDSKGVVLDSKVLSATAESCECV